MKEKLHIIPGLVAVLFGVMTLKAGGASLFTEAGRLAAGDYVPFVLWFNFIAGFLYITTGVAIVLRKPWAKLLAKILAISTASIFLAFLGHILLGGVYEMKTMVALIFRGTFWTIIWIVLSKLSLRRPL